MTTWPEFAVAVRWTPAGLEVHADAAGAARGGPSPHRRQLFMVGEVHGRQAAPTPDLLHRLFETGRGGPAPAAGGYALAVVDHEKRTVLLATDPCGIRPLYYWSDGDRVVFGTRLAGLAAVGGLRTEIDPTAVYHYLNFSYVPGPGTIFRDVFVLPPGSVARCAKGKVDVRPYWDMTYPADLRGSDAELAVALREQVERAVAESVAPAGMLPATGTFLSGGTDSGTISALLARRAPDLDAYSIAFDEGAYNELGYARLIAHRYQLRHHVHVLTVDDLLESLTAFAPACDQPFGNPSAIATWRCARLARESGVELLVAGDGGDELFGGNERYRKDRVYAVYHRLPAAVRRSLKGLARAMPGEHQLLNRARNIIERGDLPNPERLYSDDALVSRRWDTLVASGLGSRLHTRDASLDVMRAHWEAVGPVHDVDRLMYVDLKTAIWGNDLPKVVTASRAAGVRVRFPFLDPALAAFTGRLGPRMKMRGLAKRYLFKRAVADLLPRDVLEKPKHGFGVPVGEWVRTERRVRDVVLAPILDAASPLGDYLTRAGREALVDEHLKERWDHGPWLWALMMLARWQVGWKDRHDAR